MRAALKLLAFVSASCLLAAADFRAGVGRIDITPETPIWLSGYAARTRPAETVLQKLWAKAVVLEAGRTRAVIVTTDLIGLPRPVSEEVAARALKQYGLPRALLLLNSSHTHSGPVLRANLSTMYNLTPEQDERVRRYTRKLVEDLVSVIGGALADLAPARVEFGRGAAAFAINRREPTPRGVKIGLNPAGPVDHEVPVLRISAPDGRLRAVLFGYACHNTTLSGYEVNGDYAGFAQSEFEDAHPGATGLFLMLCGGDQNPHPRGEVALARQHGKALAEVVAGVIRQPMATVQPPLRAAFTLTELVFAPHTRQTFEEELQSDNPYRRRRAAEMLQRYDEGRPVRRLAYPVQALRLGKGLTIVALGGEVVIDYVLRLKKEYPGANLVVAGYSNDVMCYIPSLRVLKEGGYEANDSMVYYGQPGPFNEDVEDTVIAAARRVLQRVGLARR